MNEYLVKGKKVWLMSLHELSKLVGLKSRTMRKWEKEGFFPKPALTKPISTPVAKDSEQRLYLECQANVLYNWVKKYGFDNKRLFCTKEKWDELNIAWNKVTEEYFKELSKKDFNSKGVKNAKS